MKGILISSSLTETFSDLLLNAIYEGSLEKLTNLLSDNMETIPSSALVRAAERGRADCVKILIQFGANVNLKFDGNTALHVAALYNFSDTVKLLIDSKADIDGPSHDFNITPLMAAASAGHFELVNLLINSGACINKVDLKGRTPLMHAAYYGRNEIISLLIEKGAVTKSLDFQRKSALIHTVMDGVNVEDKFRYQESVKALIQGGVDIHLGDKTQKTPLMYAISGRNLSIVNLLLQHDAKVNQKDKEGNSAVHYCARYGNKKIMKSLIRANASLYETNKKGWTPIQIAADVGNRQCIQLLLSEGINLNGYFLPGKSPLMLATISKDIKTVSHLLNIGANPYCLDENGNSLLMLGLRAKNIILINLFIREGNINARNNQEETALMIAAQWGDGLIVKQLINAGANLNDQDKNGDTSLLHAVKQGNIEATRYLIQPDTINQVNNHGETALEIALAKRRGSEQNIKEANSMINLLLQAGAFLPSFVSNLFLGGSPSFFKKSNLTKYSNDMDFGSFVFSKKC